MNTQAPPQPQQPQQQNQVIQQPIIIQAQYVKDLSFENPGAPNVLSGQNQPPEIAINLDMDGRQLGERQFEVLLKINAEAKTDGNTIFITELTYGGVCAVAEQVPKEQIAAVAMIEGARHLFPFARSVLATATRDGGFPPLLMNPVNFVAYYQQLVARRQQEQQAQAAAQNGETGQIAPNGEHKIDGDS